MMLQRGFSLVELLVVIAIMTILMSIAGLKYNEMQKKATIEREVTTIYSSLMELRLQAVYSKTGRAVAISGKQFSIYSSQVTTVAPVSVTPLPYPVVMSPGGNPVMFGSNGLMTAAETSICIDPSGTLATNPGYVDSVDVAVTKIYMGKRSGGACVPADIDEK